jgi:two-component system NtrC family sensor kinase
MEPSPPARAPGDVLHVLGPEYARELDAAQRSIVARPSISIRLRLLLSLFLCFVLCASLAFTTVWILRSVKAKVRFLEAVESLSFQVQHARRFEKNYFLYGTGLAEAKLCASAARAILRQQDPELGRTADLARHLEAYEALLGQCPQALPAGGEELARLESLRAGIRSHGSAVSEITDGLASRERLSVERLLTRSQRLPLLLLAALLVFLALVSAFFTAALMGPIRRFQAYTRQIAGGDFTLIRPARWYRDEFSDLALAVNSMLASLRSEQERCIRAGKLAAVGTITSGIAHELNNPLNNISITTEALMEDFNSLPDERKWKLLQDIYFETERASEIVKSLLDFTRSEKLEMTPLDLREVILSSQRLVQNEMSYSNVDFSLELPADLPPILGASNQLRQVFLNLFINAVHAMPSGGRLTVKAAGRHDGRVCVEVADTGTGIPPDALPRIFDPFFTTKEPGEGTGLGLSVSYSIVKKHGGEIEVASEAGKGTVFHLCLPAAEQA